jgi:hypothetical protein
MPLTSRPTCRPLCGRRRDGSARRKLPAWLLHRLHADGFAAEHIITLGWRGASDTRIRERLQDDQVLFLTQDDDFLFGPTVSAIVLVSRVKQSRRLSERIEVWRSAVQDLTSASRPERLFELMDDGTLVLWRDAGDLFGS